MCMLAACLCLLMLEKQSAWLPVHYGETYGCGLRHLETHLSPHIPRASVLFMFLLAEKPCWPCRKQHKGHNSTGDWTETIEGLKWEEGFWKKDGVKWKSQRELSHLHVTKAILQPVKESDLLLTCVHH